MQNRLECLSVSDHFDLLTEVLYGPDGTCTIRHWLSPAAPWGWGLYCLPALPPGSEDTPCPE